MKFNHTNTYAGDLDSVSAMLLSSDFRERVCSYIRALDHSVEVSTTGATTTVAVTQTQAVRKVPALAQKFVGDTVQIVQTEVWSSPVAATFSMEMPGKPGHLRGAIALVETASGVDQNFTGEVKVNIPLVAGKLESLIGDLLRKALTYEGRVGVSWLEERS